MNGNRLRFFRDSLFLSFALLLVPPSSVFAGEGSDRKFSFNAYLTQAYGETDGGKVLGLEEEGTLDYRTAAILTRFQWTPRDSFVVQLSHEALGASPLGAVRDDIEVDWAFYEHRFQGGLGVRLGRVPIPFGIYNEIRDVGTMLEFYRPPVSVYFEGAFSAESVDGVVVSKEFFVDHAWPLSVDVYGGTWERSEYIAPQNYEGDAKNARGLQLWLQTPVDGLRVGLAYQHFDQEGGATFLRHPDSNSFETLLVSLDANFERLVVRAEGQWLETAFNIAPEVEIPAYYGLVGWRFTEELEIYALFETSSSRWKLGDGLPTFKFGPQYEDRAIAMVYRFTPNTMLRLEAHHYETLVADEPQPFGAAVVTDFSILSFSLRL